MVPNDEENSSKRSLLKEIAVENQYARYVLQKEVVQRISQRKNVKDGDLKLIVSTAHWIQNELASQWSDTLNQAQTVFGAIPEQSEEGREPNSQLVQYMNLVIQDKVIREYLDTWTIYDIAWAQRRNKGLGVRRIAISVDRIVAYLYGSVINEHLNLYAMQTLISVFFENEAYTRPSRSSPTPYVVIPRWALRHTWVGCAVAHEVGHNVLWNVQGLYDELLVTLVTRLIANEWTIPEIRIWGRWLEELFADLFGVLQVGPAIINSLERLLGRLPPPLLAKVNIVGANEILDSMWKAYDLEHPVRYLRPFLAIDALKKLLPNMQDESERIEKEITALEDTWIRFIKSEYPSRTETIKVEPGSERSEYDAQDLDTFRQKASIVLDVILSTRLYALAKTETPNQPRSITDVFFKRPDYAAIDATTKKLISRDPVRGVDLNVILAAAEYAFEQRIQRIPDDVSTVQNPALEQLYGLSERILTAITPRQLRHDLQIGTWLSMLKS